MASLHFYRYFLDNNDRHTTYDLSTLIDHINKIRNKSFGNIQINMYNHWDTMSKYYKPHKDNTLRFFWIDKSMTHNPYTGPLGSSERKPVKENHLYNPASCLLFSNYHLLMIFQPQGSPSYNEITDYLNNFVQSGKHINDKLKIVMHPLTNSIPFNKINKFYKIKKIYFDINPNEFLAQGTWKSDIHHNKIIDIANSVSSIYHHFSNKQRTNDNKNYIELSFDKYRFGEPLSYGLINYLRESILNNNVTGIIKMGAYVQKPGKTGYTRIEVKNGKTNNANLLKKFNLHQKNPGWNYIYDKMIHFYYSDDFPIKIAQNFNINNCDTISNKEVFFNDNPKHSYHNLKRRDS